MTDALQNLADVSVIMPAYNNQDSVGRALASIAAQTLKPREVIVVDDGSSDDTIGAVRAMKDHMNGVTLRLFHQENNGAGAARNRAVVEARGEWLGFLDADDQWLPGKLEKTLCPTLDRGLEMSAHNLVSVAPDGQERMISSRARWLGNPADPYRRLFLVGFISSSTVLVRRRLVVQVGGFDVGLRSAQDYELWLALLDLIGHRFEVFADPLLRYTLAPQGITSAIDRKVSCSLAILNRHMGVLKRHPGPMIKWLVLRLLIIHLEAVQGHWQRGQRAAALGQIWRFLPRLGAVLARFPKARGQRPDFLAHLPPAADIAL